MQHTHVLQCVMEMVQLTSNPSRSGPNFRFNNGTVENGEAVFLPTVPVFDAPTSDWSIIQWHKNQYIDPNPNYLAKNNSSDAIYGSPLFVWETSDKESQVSAFVTPDGYVYELRSRGGNNDSRGGSNLFISANVASGTPATLDHPITLSMNAKFSNASAPRASSSLVSGQAFIGFTINYNSPESSYYNAKLPVYSSFMQIYMSTTNPNGNSVWAVTSGATAAGGLIEYGTTLPGDPTLAWISSQGVSQHLTYNVNDYAKAMLTAAAPTIGGASNDLNRWSIGSVYIGLETIDTTSAIDSSALSAALQLSNIDITTDLNSSYDQSQTHVGSSLSSDAQTIQFTDTTNGIHGQVQASKYTGPFSGLESQYIYDGNDAMAFIAPPHSFIRGGPSSDAIVATGGGNVIDGGVNGTDMLVGGKDLNDPDHFFLEGFAVRPGAITWSTIVNFHVGDTLTFWGYDPKLWSMQWINHAGDPSSGGLTLWAQEKFTGANALATFDGLNQADLASLRQINGTSATGLGYLLVVKN